MYGPGYINTWRNRAQFENEEEVEQRGQHIPVKRVGQPSGVLGSLALL